MPELGRVTPPPDPRDAAFPMSLALAATVPPTTKYWHPGTYALNQGNLGACVGFTGANWLQNSPTRTKVTNQTGLDLYWACKAIDGIPDVEGTYDRALMKVLAARGQVKRYLWAQSPTEMLNWMLTQGPVLVGVNWYESFFNPGYRAGDTTAPWLEIGGNVAGGHEFLLRGFSNPRQAYRMRNSWGSSWAKGGEAWISKADMERLVFAEGGDACGAEECVPA